MPLRIIGSSAAARRSSVAAAAVPLLTQHQAERAPRERVIRILRERRAELRLRFVEIAVQSEREPEVVRVFGIVWIEPCGPSQMIECRRETLLLGQQLAEHEVELRPRGIPLHRRRECADRLVQVLLLPPPGGTLVAIPERDGELITALGVIRIRLHERAQPDERAIQIAGGSAGGRGVGAGGREAGGRGRRRRAAVAHDPEHHAPEVAVRIVAALLRVQPADACEQLLARSIRPLRRYACAST